MTTDELIELADGTVYQDSHLIHDENNLFVYVCCGKTIVDVFNDFCDPEKTKTIMATRYGEISSFDGYTHIRSISEESSGIISLCMRKG